MGIRLRRSWAGLVLLVMSCGGGSGSRTLNPSDPGYWHQKNDAKKEGGDGAKPTAENESYEDPIEAARHSPPSPPPGAPGKSQAAAPASQPVPSGPSDPVREKATAFREAADLLDKAAAAKDRGSKSFAEQLFSSAELLVGPEAVAELAQVFRAGAPPRVATPTTTIKDTAPQPVAVGREEPKIEDEPPPKPHQPKPVKKEKATVSGTVMIDGKAPNGELGMVTFEPEGGRKGAFPVQRIMEQRNRQFAPRLLVVTVGSTVTFPNFDPVFHNVFSTSETKPFDLGLYKNGEARVVVFDREGIVRLGCNLHANMAATIVVVSAPYYTITDGNGRYTFTGLEPGRYLVKAWSERSNKTVTQTVDLKPGKNSIDVGVAGDAPKGPLPDKFGVARGKT